MARILRIDPVICLSETDTMKRVARWAAADVYQQDDERQAAKQEAAMAAAKARGGRK